jgi:serine/threonine protein kinase
MSQYKLLSKLGEGGMGIVYRASHAMLRRPTAIKLLPGSSASAAERFEREVQITARLTHPNTIAVFDYGRTPDGIFYYAMEYVGGMSLDDLIAIDGPQPPRRVVHLLLQVCGALAEAHAAGLVHRDIKPANLMLTERGGVHDVVKVLDFGLVKEISGFGKDAPAENAVLGTPHFMAPEAILDPAGIDGRADLYALGATAYYLLTGTHVFDGKDVVAVCSQHLHDLPEPPSRRRDLPASLERVILACLEKKADARPRDAAALAVDLRACALGEWTEEEARGWWDAPRSDRATPREGALSATNVDAFGTTMEIALDDRVA